MDFLYSILAGIAGTLLMTLFMDLTSLMTRNNFHVPKILGAMITSQRNNKHRFSTSLEMSFWGYVLHYAIGSIFAVVYFLLWKPENRHFPYCDALTFGALAGMVAIIFWYCFIKLHPQPPKIKLLPYLIFIYLGHLIFALGMNFFFRLVE